MAKQSGEKEPVVVTLGEFKGLSAHVHVTIRSRSLPDGEPVERYMKFYDSERARRWVEYVFESEFSPDTHELVYEPSRARGWFYREGD